MKTDIQIAQENQLEDIDLIARKAKIDKDFLCHYGKYKAKVDLSIMSKVGYNKNGKLILVTAINPTKAGEGKSTTTVGLADGLNALNKAVIGCLREPSLGPVFGLKGGAAGGGFAQVVPMEDINLHFTGDMHAITTANNLISAVLDNSIYQGNPLNIDPERVIWKRCLDMNDRNLRSITIGQDKKTNGVERKDGFIITVASEVMAILCLSDDLQDFISKVKECVIAYNYDGKMLKVKDLEIEGSLGVIMKDAINPNLVQTLEHTPMLIHGGPFANIAHGCNSVIATKLALKLADYVVTEAGFGADLGAEKFLDIKCRKAELTPNAVVLVTTCRAMKMHAGIEAYDLNNENIEAVIKGTCNLQKHIESIQKYNVPFIVAINRFAMDSLDEIRALQKWCVDNQYQCEVSNAWEQGSKGTTDLATKVIELCEKDNSFKYLYDLEETVENKILTISREIYGADNVEYSKESLEQLQEIKDLGYTNLAICMAKTPASLSDNAKLIGRPTGFNIHVKDIKLSLGAGFIVVYTGNVLTMPGLPKHPSALDMGVDEKGSTFGLF
jgi:formate--tetrahydrofolate ligase